MSLCATTGRWKAYLTVGGKQVHLGRFKDIDGAVEARNDAFQKQYGAFARL